MEWDRGRKLMIRWSIFTAGLIILFWTTWCLTDKVPVIHSLKMTRNWTITLPFGIPQWSTVLLGPIYSVILILILKILANKNILSEFLIFSLILGLLLSLASGVGVRLGFGPSIGLIPIIASILGLLFVMLGIVGFSLEANLDFFLGSGLGIALGTSLTLAWSAGPIASIGFILGLILTIGFIAGLIISLKYLFSRKFWPIIWEALGNWLMAK